MRDVVIALMASPAVGLAQFDPSVGGENGAAELFGIDKGLRDQDGVASSNSTRTRSRDVC